MAKRESSMTAIWDWVIGLASLGLCFVTLPMLFNKNAQVPRWTSAYPMALLLSIMILGFYEEGLIVTTIALIGQAIIWWLIATFRGINVPHTEAPITREAVVG